MHRPQRQVRMFMEKIGAATAPAPPGIRDATLRAHLIAEEAAETVVALLGRDDAIRVLLKYAARATDGKQLPDLVGALDGICDLLYVTYGTAEAIGVDVEPFFDEVHRSNMTKGDGPTGDTAGKRGSKGDGYSPPNLRAVLQNVRMEMAQDGWRVPSPHSVVTDLPAFETDRLVPRR